MAFFMKFEQMSRVGSWDRHAWWRSKIYVIFEKDLGIVNDERITYIIEKSTTIYIEYLPNEKDTFSSFTSHFGYTYSYLRL